MTSTALNAEFASILDEIAAQIERFASLRDAAPDEAWDEATELLPYGDLLNDLEYDVEQAMEQALGQALAR